MTRAERSPLTAVGRLLAASLAALLFAAAAPAQDLTVYDDALQNGFADYSYGGQPGDVNFASTAQHHTGAKSIAFVGRDYNAVSFAHPTQDFTTAQYPTLRLWVHGGAAGGQQLRLYLQLNDAIVAQAELDTYVSGGAIAAGTWREVTVTLGQAPLSYAGSFDRIDVQSDVGGVQPVLYIDDVSLVAGAAPPASALQIEHGVTVASMVSDRFTWRDGAGLPRVAVLAHNDGQVGPGGVRGGALRELRYQLPDGSTRVAGVTSYGNGGYGGFGYVVAHAANSSCIGDDSPLGDFFPGQFQRVFEGRHHAIFRFTQSYVRNCSTTLPVQQRTVPVTIDWVVATGRDNPLWAVTWDLSGVPANTFYDDTRAPYGELEIDGEGFTDIDGVAWGDRYKFTSTTAPVTLDSQWTWNVPNSVPYVKLWIEGPLTMLGRTRDATMGLVQTQTMSQQDAGGGRTPGYHDLKVHWGKTSADGNAGGAHAMPWQDSWPFQANAFSIGPGSPNNNARLTWGAQYGFLGQQSYPVNDGVVATASGYPRKSYSVYVVLGTHTSSPVEAQVAQVETVQSLALAASVGSVATSGPAGVARADTGAYAPAGYDHVYGALAFTASGNQLDATIAVGVGTLRKPLVIVRGYTGGAPTSVKLAGASLVADADYFASVRAGASELWLTLNRDLTGAPNRLEIGSSGTPPPAPTIQASGPTAFCAGGSVTLTASIAEGAGVSYLWSPGGQTTRAIAVTASGSYSVTVTVGGQPGTSAATTVTVSQAPATPSISAPASATPGQAGLVASVASHAGSSYAWAITNGTVTAGQGTAQVTFTAGAAGTATLSVVETTGGCPSAQATRSVTVSGSATELLLAGNRFRVTATWRNYNEGPGGPTRQATAVPFSGDTGTFWFFGATNVELVVKVLPTPQGGYLVMYGSLSDVEFDLTVKDLAPGGLTRLYHNPPHTLASVADVLTFSSPVTPPGRPSASASRPPLPSSTTVAAAGACTADATTLCLSGGRFRLRTAWRNYNEGPGGPTRQATAVPMTADTGTFWFFASTNVELVIKVLEQAPGDFLVMYGALSDVEYDITVEDLTAGASHVYHNPPHHLASVADGTSF